MNIITVKRDVFVKAVSEMLEAAGMGKEISISLSDELFDDLGEASYTESSPLILAKAIYYQRRFILNMTWVKMASPSSKEWSSIEALSEALLGMAKHFDIPYQTFCKEYAEALFKIRPRLKSKFVYAFLQDLNDDIFLYFEAKDKIRKDSNPKITQECMDKYCKKVLVTTGVVYQPSQDDHSVFVDIAQYCKDNKVSPKTFIDGAFNLLEFKKAIPKPRNMLGEKFLLSVAELKGKTIEPSVKKVNLKTLRENKW